MTERSQFKRIPLGEMGAYCDPMTSECYPFDSQKQATMVAVDPVCKVEVKIETAPFKSEFQGLIYYFCTSECQQSFEKDPHAYIAQHSQVTDVN
ncbi:MAG: YHS domain-containing protein [Chloroflexota bacterium]|jgi:Cu+-exporting ATPase